MFHLSRGVRWDSDHTLTQEDPFILQVFQELKRADLLDKKVGIGLDFFDAQINRVTAWIVGLRAAGKSLLTALLEPTAQMQQAEYAGNLGRRMAMLDECRNLPVNAVWDYLCWKKNAGVGMKTFGTDAIFTATNTTSGLTSKMPMTFIVFAVVLLLAFILLRYTFFGRGIYAIGGNPASANCAGYNVKRTKFILYILAGVIASLGGLCRVCMRAQTLRGFLTH